MQSLCDVYLATLQFLHSSFINTSNIVSDRIGRPKVPQDLQPLLLSYSDEMNDDTNTASVRWSDRAGSSQCVRASNTLTVLALHGSGFWVVWETPTPPKILT